MMALMIFICNRIVVFTLVEQRENLPLTKYRETVGVVVMHHYITKPNARCPNMVVILRCRVDAALAFSSRLGLVDKHL